MKKQKVKIFHKCKITFLKKGTFVFDFSKNLEPKIAHNFASSSNFSSNFFISETKCCPSASNVIT